MKKILSLLVCFILGGMLFIGMLFIGVIDSHTIKIPLSYFSKLIHRNDRKYDDPFHQTDVADWSRIYFKELGFSIKVPSPTDLINSKFDSCENKKITQCAPLFLAIEDSSLELENLDYLNTHSPFIIARSTSATIPRLISNFIEKGQFINPSIFSLPYDFYEKNGKYYFVPVPNVFVSNFDSTTQRVVLTQNKLAEFEIQPVFKTTRQGHEIIIFNILCDYENSRSYKEIPCKKFYRIFIKLNNKYFKIASLTGQMGDFYFTSLKELELIINTIEFDNP